MGLTISTDEKGVKIFRKEHDGQNGKWYTYSMKVASKTMQGEWLNGYVDCTFKKGIGVNNKAVINIKNAFPTVTKYQEKTYVKWMILDFDVIDNGEAEVPVNTQQEMPDFMNVPDGINDEIPFD